MIIRKTKKEEDKRVNELFAIAFELPAEDGPADEKDNPRVHHWAAFEDTTGAMMSTFTISDFNIRFDDHICKMGGIGGVATLPQYRRMGGIRGCFQESLPDMYHENYDFSYLYPFSTAYYRKFGYECCVQKMMVSVNLGLLKPEAADGSFILCENQEPMTEAIQSLDEIWESRYNMMVIHNDEDYDWTRKFDPAGKQEFTYVYKNASGSPKAYTTFKKADQPDGRNLVCSRFCFADKEGFMGLMNLFKSLSADHMFVKFSLPLMSGMEFLMPEWAMGAAMWSVQNAGMVRVINVENVLKKASYHGTGSVCLEITDRQIPENNGIFNVAFTDGLAVSVAKGNGTPDAKLEISAFSALISGVYSLQDIKMWLNGLEVIKNEKALSQVFRKKTMMIADYF